MPGPEARAVPCPLCNEKFFPASLPFHQKQCEKRRATRIVNCPYCKTEVSQLDLPKHIQNCPKCKSSSGGGGGGGRGGDSGGPGPGGSGGARRPSHEPRAASGPTQFEPERLDDGRMRCVYCGRFFSDERIEKHQNICGNLKNARPKGVDGQPTQTGAKVFDAKAQRTGGGSAFVSREMYDKRVHDREKEVKRDQATKQKKSSWRKQHEDFVNACRAGRGEEVQPSTQPVSRAGQLQCHHCGRWFSEDAAERHIPICAKVVNRPKPPPSPARPPTHRGEASPKQRRGHGEDDMTLRSTASAGAVGGSGAKAARSLRGASAEGRKSMESPPSARSRGPSPSPASRGQQKEKITTHAGPERLDETTLPEGRGMGGQQRALLLRLMRQVPEATLRQELMDVGVACESDDKEALVQALVQQLT